MVATFKLDKTDWN